MKTMPMIRAHKLAKITGVRLSTIKWYSEIGLLPFEQKGAGLSRYYNLNLCVQRLKEIDRLKKQGKGIKEITQVLKL